MSFLPTSDAASLTRSWTGVPAAGVGVRRLPATLVPGLVSLLTLALFSPAIENGFVDWDDSVVIVKNMDYRGLGWNEIRWMFSTILMGHYAPLTWMSLGLDHVLWGMDPAGYHFTSILLHAVNAALFYCVALRLFRAGGVRPMPVFAAAAAALFFAVHPLRVESVAWVTERRDVLSGLFFFLTLLAYLSAVEREGRARIVRHGVACVLYLFAILSKSMVMSLPALLVLLDVYPLRRLDGSLASWRRRDIWWEKVPYVALGVLAALLGYYGQAANRFLTSLEQVPWSERPTLVAWSLWFYVAKTVMPLDLSPLYELPATVNPLDPGFLGPTIAILVAAAVVVGFARHWPMGLAAAVAYAIVIAPVSGILHAGHQLTHDRYSYLACLPLALLVGAGVIWVRRAVARSVLRPGFAQGIAVAFVLWLGALGFLTWHQIGAWRNSETLWRHAVAATPECSVCELNLATEYLNQHRTELAKAHFERALANRPDRVKGFQNLGLAYARQGQIEIAADHFRRVLATKPDDAQTLMNLGVSLMKLRRPAEGLIHLRRAQQAAPSDWQVLGNLGTALTETGRPGEAIAVLRRAIEIAPDAALPRYALVGALHAAGDPAAARRELAFLRVVDPGAASLIGPALVETW